MSVRAAPPPPPPPGEAPLSTSAARAGLPETLLRTPHALVVHGDDAGEFYCEHAFFTAQQAAVLPGSQVAKNRHGEVLVGFLHVPHDDVTGLEGPTLDQEQRHRGTRDVVGAALRGFFDHAVDVDPAGPVRVLLTGYREWGAVKNNPTGDFVAHADNVDAAMLRAFGRELLTPAGKRLGGDERSERWGYRVRGRGGPREVQIQTTRLAVDDDAINGGERSLQAAMRAFSPHAVLSMGVHPGVHWVAEHHADDGGLGERDGLLVHDPDAPARTPMPDNFSLPRAILAGARSRADDVVV